MNPLKDIIFVQVCKKRPKGVKKTTWVRNCPKFNEKAKLIKMRATEINQKLVNY